MLARQALLAFHKYRQHNVRHSLRFASHQNCSATLSSERQQNQRREKVPTVVFIGRKSSEREDYDWPNSQYLTGATITGSWNLVPVVFAAREIPTTAHKEEAPGTALERSKHVPIFCIFHVLLEGAAFDLFPPPC